MAKKAKVEFLTEENLDDIAWCMGMVASNMDELEDLANEADPDEDEKGANDDYDDVEITLPGQLFIALFNSHMLAFETLFEAGLISEDDMEQRINRIFGDGHRLH